MEENKLEPGFLQAFRLFIATRIFFWAVIGPVLIVIQTVRGEPLTPEQMTSMGAVENLTPANTSRMIMMELLLLLLLMLPRVQRRLGKWFVPMALTLALIPLLIGYYWWPSANPLQTPFVMFFFVMLVLIAWQYSFSYVLVYVVGLTLYQYSVSAAETSLPWTVDVSWLVLQAAMMLLVGYVIVTLATVQREQRAALALAYDLQAAANERLQQYAATVEELTISRERNRLARELHDTLAHSLSAVTVQLEAVRSLWQVDPERARTILDQADETARTGLTEARRALQALRASPLQDLGLVLALRELAESAAERSGASLELDLPTQMEGHLEPIVEQGAYRIAQEALENIVRHAQAGLIAVRFEQRSDVLELSIEDDGLGLDAEALSPAGEGEEGNLGIRGMQERADLIDGQLQISSREGQGTEVSLTVVT
ncbi:sensor histidine kinase [Chloroflexota bacterium]